MATTAVQAVEKNITSVALADIQPSNYNPRKNFDETSLAETDTYTPILDNETVLDRV